MRRLLKENKLLFTLTLLLSAALSVAYVYIAIILQRVTDTAVNGDMEGFRRIVAISVAYLLGIGTVNFIYTLLSKQLVCRVVRQLRQRIFNGILRRNTEDFSSVNTADYISAVTNDVKMIEDNGILPLLSVVQNGVIFVAASVVLFTINVFIGICLMSCLVLMFAIPALFGKALQSRQDIVSRKMSDFTAKVKDFLSGYEVIKAYGMEDYVRSEYQMQNDGTTAAKFNAEKLTAANTGISEVMAYLTVFSGLFIGAYFVLKGSISAGVLLALIQLSSSFVNPLMVVMNDIPKVQGIKPVMDRLQAVMDYQDTAFIGTKAPTFDRDIHIRDLSFSYRAGLPVLKDVSFQLEKSKKYAVVGHSGSGKSTLIRLLCGTYADFDGEISYDGQELRTLDIESLRGMISVIHQNVYMFSGSILDNICLYRTFSGEELEDVLSVSGVKLFLDSMPAGLDSPVGENGSNLSGGQRQRIAVARALMQKTPVLILDEGTAAIDMQTAYSIENSLLDIEGLTLITITHNMSPELLGRYDRILFMKDGRICESGSLDELLQSKGEFYYFYHLPQA